MPRKTGSTRGGLETSGRFNEAAARCRGKRLAEPVRAAVRPPASMRPRPDAAENPPTPMMTCRLPKCFNEAAARCRGKHTGRRSSTSGCASFNEAAARCRGKRVSLGRLGVSPGASMRPRPDAAENAHVPVDEQLAGAASMRPRPDAAENRSRWTWFRAQSSCCFNEAAARCRGKRRAMPSDRQRRTDASMRPRPDAAENLHRSQHPPAGSAGLQ